VVYLSSYGGGVVAADGITVRADIGRNATAVVATQGFTKVYAPHIALGRTLEPQTAHSEANAMEVDAAHEQLHANGDGRTHITPSPIILPAPAPAVVDATQRLWLRVSSGGLLLWIPDPTLLYARARFCAPTVIELQDSGSVLFLDWLHGGRVARGECFDFERYATSLHVHHRSSSASNRVSNGAEESKSSPSTHGGTDVMTPILHEALVLEQQGFQGTAATATRPSSSSSSSAASSSALSARLAPYVVFCTCVLLGSRLEGLARCIQSHVDAWHLRKQPPARHYHAGGGAHTGKQQATAQQPPPVIVSCTWIDVPVGATAGATSVCATVLPAASSSSSVSSVRGCVLRLSGTSLEPVQAMLSTYLSPLHAMLRVKPPWSRE